MNGSTDKTHSLAQYIAACIGIVFFGVAFLVLGAILPILTQEYNLDNVMSSTLAGILPSAILAGSLLFGLIIATAGKISIVMAGIACMGLSGGFLNGATNALASDVSTDRNRDRNLMLLGLFYCGGAILTTYLIPAFAETYPYRKILSAAAAIMFASCLYYIFIRFPKGKCAEGIPVKKVIALLKHPVLLILSISLFFQSALEGITGNRVSQYLIEMESFSLKDAGIALRVEFRIHDIVVNVLHDGNDGGNIVLHVGNFYIGDGAAGRELLEFAFKFQFVKSIYSFSYINMV